MHLVHITFIHVITYLLLLLLDILLLLLLHKLLLRADIEGRRGC